MLREFIENATLQLRSRALKSPRLDKCICITMISIEDAVCALERIRNAVSPTYLCSVNFTLAPLGEIWFSATIFALSSYNNSINKPLNLQKKIIFV